MDLKYDFVYLSNWGNKYDKISRGVVQWTQNMIFPIRNTFHQQDQTPIYNVGMTYFYRLVISAE